MLYPKFTGKERRRYLYIILRPNEKVLGAFFAVTLAQQTFQHLFVVKCKNPKKLVVAGLTICEAVVTNVKDSPLANNEFILKPSSPFYIQK